ncbi:MAG: HD domain-containing protein [Candidatus Gracilibacteria bacterium]|jgi:putative hydrolase of HD superfamily|nr:HD domain-containing protein [Candidatus Gracilibacteria bacterium]
MKRYNQIADFFFELSVLKKIPRTGSLVAGIKNPDTVAEHVFRTTEIAFVLADLMGADPFRTAFMASIHDNGEARIMDHHKIMSRYLDKGEAEERAFLDQIQKLPRGIAKRFKEAFLELQECKTLEAICAHDADLLELAFQSKEFLEQGYLAKQGWLDNIEMHLTTDVARGIFEAIKNKSYNDWWIDLKRVD